MPAADLVNLSGLRDDAKCFALVRQHCWPEGVCCPECASSSVIPDGCDDTQPHRQRYRCKACASRLDDLTGTVLAGHHQPLRVWVLCLPFMGLNLSNRQIAAELGLATSYTQDMTVPPRRGLVEGASGGTARRSGVGCRSTASLIAPTVADIGVFQSVQHFTAWPGLVPRQHPTGEKTRLGRITETGNREIRRLLLLGATSIVHRAAHWNSAAKVWARGLLKRRPVRLVTVAWANEMARIAPRERPSAFPPLRGRIAPRWR